MVGPTLYVVQEHSRTLAHRGVLFLDDSYRAAGIIDFLTMYPAARRRVVKLLGEMSAGGRGISAVAREARGLASVSQRPREGHRGPGGVRASQRELWFAPLTLRRSSNIVEVEVPGRVCGA